MKEFHRLRNKLISIALCLGLKWLAARTADGYAQDEGSCLARGESDAAGRGPVQLTCPPLGQEITYEEGDGQAHRRVVRVQLYDRMLDGSAGLPC